MLFTCMTHYAAFEKSPRGSKALFLAVQAHAKQAGRRVQCREYDAENKFLDNALTHGRAYDKSASMG
jgi:hypothetical protein